VLAEMLLRISGQRDAPPLVEAPEQDAHLDGRELLHLVDGDVAVAHRERPDAQLPGVQEERRVLVVELRLHARVAPEPAEDLG